jgi:RNA polymerase sigma-70 factor (ECF subfamily)
VPDIEAERRFTALYEAHQHQVYAYAVSRAGRQIADEVVSETFTVAWRRFADLPPASLPWLLGVARNVMHEQARSARMRDSLAAELRAWATPRDQESADPGDVVTERDAVRSALTRLAEDDRELLTLVAWHGLSTTQAAQVIGCSSATYFVRLHRARRRLEAALQEAPAPRRTHVPGKDVAR